MPASLINKAVIKELAAKAAGLDNDQGDARLTRRAAAPAMLGEAQAGSRRERRLVRDGKGDVLQMALGVGM